MPQQAPINPTLPQNDTPAQLKAREVQIVGSQSIYQWTEAVPALPGVPVVANVPAAEQPTLEWWLKLVGILADIARNSISVEEQHILSELEALDPALIIADKALVGLAEQEVAALEAKIAANPHTKTGLIADLEEGIDIVIADGAIASLKNHVTNLRAVIERRLAEQAGGGSVTPGSLDTYRDLFQTLHCPPVAWTFEDDLEFAHLRVAGPNSILIEAVTAIPAGCPVSADDYAAVVANDSLDAALAQGRMFGCDYKALSILIEGEWQGLSKYVTCPVALFAVPPGAGTLVPVAICCDPSDPASPVVTPSLDPERQWAWQLAKLCVEVADGNYHELYAHLAHTHLVIEAVAVATHRHLANQHPVWALLVRHFEGTMFINEAAATSLITPGGPIDHIFAGTIASSQETAATARLSFDFTGGMLPNDLARRGVTADSTLAEYPYRDDALLVWDAIERWVRDYLNVYYDGDAAVFADTEVSAWATAIANDGRLNGFVTPTTVAELTAICTMTIFTASAQHAAVNFPQRAIMEFAPAVTGALWQPTSDTIVGLTKADWLAAMPPQKLALEQLAVLNLLGSLYYRPLGSYRSPDFPYPTWFQDPQIVAADGPLARFQQSLQTVEDAIVARNANRRRPYSFLLPSLIPSSTNI